MAGPVRPQGGPTPFRHLAHVPSFRENPIVFFTTCTSQRRKILASPHCHTILREIWERSADRDGWWVGHYILMPDHVHFFARLKSVRAVWPIGCRCGKALALDKSRRRFPSIRPPGRRIISIDICDPAKSIPKNGITLSKTRFGRALSRPLMCGRTAERFMI